MNIRYIGESTHRSLGLYTTRLIIEDDGGIIKVIKLKWLHLPNVVIVIKRKIFTQKMNYLIITYGGFLDIETSFTGFWNFYYYRKKSV